MQTVLARLNLSFFGSCSSLSVRSCTHRGTVATFSLVLGPNLFFLPIHFELPRLAAGNSNVEGHGARTIARPQEKEAEYVTKSFKCKVSHTGALHTKEARDKFRWPPRHSWERSPTHLEGKILDEYRTKMHENSCFEHVQVTLCKKS